MQSTAERSRTARRFSAATHGALDKLYLRHHGVHSRRMFGYPAYFVGQRMFACLTSSGVCLKVGEHRAHTAVGSGLARPFRPHGKAMRSWVEVVTEGGRMRVAVAKLCLHALMYVQTVHRESTE